MSKCLFLWLATQPLQNATVTIDINVKKITIKKLGQIIMIIM